MKELREEIILDEVLRMKDDDKFICWGTTVQNEKKKLVRDCLEVFREKPAIRIRKVKSLNVKSK
jgi:hypothetical protein